MKKNEQFIMGWKLFLRSKVFEPIQNPGIQPGGITLQEILPTVWVAFKVNFSTSHSFEHNNSPEIKLPSSSADGLIGK